MKWKQIQMPNELWEDPTTRSEEFLGRFVLEPLEKGYGITIGNAMRRMILSSMQGCAITSVRIDGVLHEFSSIEGVYEDVPEIILNLKGVRFKLHLDHPKPIRLDVEKEGEVKAGDFDVPAGVEILNKSHHICTITEKRRFIMDMELGVGKGFVVGEDIQDPTSPLGTIAIDAIYSPVKSVNYKVEPARVGQITDYDRLILEITTDGSMAPRDCIAMGAKLLIDHFNIFINPEVKLDQVEEDSVDEETQKVSQLLKLSVDELELSVRASNCLKNARIKYLAELVVRSESEMLKFRNFGRKSLQELQVVLSKLNLRFGMDIAPFITNEELEELRSQITEADFITVDEDETD